MRYAAAFAVWLASVSVGQAVNVTFVVDEKAWTTPPRISVLKRADDQLPEAVPVVDGEATLELSDDETWRFEPTFIITVPARIVGDNVKLHDELELELPLSIKRTSADIVIPLSPVRGIGNKELTRIELLGPFSFFEKLLLAQTLAVHFQRALPDPTEGVTRRMTRVWIDTLFEGVTGRNPKPVRLEGKVVDAFMRAFSNDAGAISTFNDPRRPLIDSSFWRDNRDRDALQRSSDCVSLRALDRFLRHNHELNEAAASTARLSDPADVLNDNEARTAARCPPGETAPAQ